MTTWSVHRMFEVHILVLKDEFVYCKYQRLYSMVATVYQEGNSRKVFPETQIQFSD